MTTAVKPTSRRPARRRSVPGTAKIYTKRNRTTGIEVFYGDFREFADVGGRCEPLRAEDARRATDDLAAAMTHYAARRACYLDRRAGIAAEQAMPTRLLPLLAEHLTARATKSSTRTSTLCRMEAAAHVLLNHLGNVPLGSITPKVLERYVETRRAEPGIRRGTMASTASIRIELSLLSTAFKRAEAFGYAADNPVRKMPEKPTAPPPRKVWLARAEAGRLLDAAAEHDVLARRDWATTEAWGLDPHAPVWQDPHDAKGRRRAARKRGRTIQWEQRRDDAEAILATLLYTGGRIAEVLGLKAGDIDINASLVRFRPNEFRQLKRDWHARDVELWSPLAAVLRAHIVRLGLTATDPLFPTVPGAARPVTRIDKLLARCCRRAGIGGRNISPHALRHTFATMLLRTFVRTTDGRTAQRSSFDAAKALGHSSSQLVDKVYGHPAREDCTAMLTYEQERQHPTHNA